MDMFTSLSHRRLTDELMDDPAIDARQHRTALRGLRRINVASRTSAALWPSIRAIAERRQYRRLSLLDIATGGGDVAIDLARRARQEGVELDVAACDISPTALAYAQQQAERAGLSVRFFQWDALTETLPESYDIVTSTLFLHHLEARDIVSLLRTLSRQIDHLVISDLLRTRVGYGLAYLGTRLLSASPVVHEDGLKSVRAALTLPEARTLASEAGLQGAHFETHWPSRFRLTWSRNATAAGRLRHDT